MAQVRIRLRTQLVGVDFDHPPGTVITVEAAEAARLCDPTRPLADYVDAVETATRERREKAVRPRGRRR